MMMIPFLISLVGWVLFGVGIWLDSGVLYLGAIAIWIMALATMFLVGMTYR